MTPETLGILRNAGLLVMGSALLMALFSFGAMLWMDVPLLILGGAIVAYASWALHRDRKRAEHAVVTQDPPR